MDIGISVIVPVYNERESLKELQQSVSTTLEAHGRHDYEIIYIDDGSTDGSTEILEALSLQNAHVVVIQLRRNYGKSIALSTGFSVARGKIFFTLDADLQDDPTEMPRLLEKVENGYDLVVGQRVDRFTNDPLSKSLPSRLANFVTTRVTGVHVKDMNSGFKCFRSVLGKSLQLHGDLHRYIPVIAYYNGFQITEVPVKHHARKYGKSKYGPGRYIPSLLDLFTVVFLGNFRYRPLHLFGTMGLVTGLVGFLILIYLTILWFVGDRPIGDRPLLLLGILLVLIGIQLVMSGLIADLLVSINRANDDPLMPVKTIHTQSELSIAKTSHVEIIEHKQDQPS